MKIERRNSFVILQKNIDFGGKQMITIPDFYNEVVENLSNFKNESLIIDLSDNTNVDLKEIMLFSQIGKELKKNNKSFVIVYGDTDFNSLPENLVIVPTLKEAEDIIEIENIERDLGF